MALTPIKSSDFLVGRPLAWNVFDADGTLLFAKGIVVDEEIKARLLKRAAFRELDAETVSNATAAGKAVLAEEGRARQRVWLSLHETSVRPGDIVHIERGLDGARLTAQFIGYQKNRSVVVTIPADAQGTVFLKEGETIVVKVFSGRHVLAFPSTVLAFVSKPFPHLHLNYPAEVSGVMVRHAKRTATRIVASFESAGEQFSGIITDLSVGGLSFVARAASIQVGAHLSCNFKLVIAECAFLLRTGCQVRSNRGGQSEVLAGATAYGAQFKDLCAEDALVLALFVCQQSILDAKPC